jgi:hypothetical protein
MNTESVIDYMPATRSDWPLLAWIGNAIFWIFLAWWIQTSKQPDDLSYLLCSTLISAVCFFLIVNPWTRDTLEPIKLIGFFYGMSFGLGPLLLAGEGIYNFEYLGRAWVRLLGEGSLWSLVGLACLLLGYYLYPTRVARRDAASMVEPPERGRRLISTMGIVLLGVGAASYILLVRLAGGLGHFMSYSAGRADIFAGVFGGFYFGTFFMIAGLGALACVHAKKHPFMSMTLAVAIGVAYALFQGREEAFAPIVCGLIAIHYGHKRLKMRWLALAASVLITVASFLGYVRGAEKSEARKAEVFLQEYQQEMRVHFYHTLSANLEQMDAFLIALRYVETTHKTFDGRTLIAWLEPVDRHIFGNVIDSVGAGRFMDILVMPQHELSNTALSPSILGELYINFAGTGIVVGLFLYGLFARALYARVVAANSNPLIMIVYPYAIWILSKAVIDGSNLFFRPFIVALPAALAYLLILLGPVAKHNSEY